MKVTWKFLSYLAKLLFPGRMKQKTKSMKPQNTQSGKALSF
nr:MAG TPA: hypothetical protein [Caudoviricetes sp.]